MKILYVQDSHIRGINPLNRIGSYYKDLMDKVKALIKLAKKYKVDYIIHGGDLYDSENVSKVLSDEFIDLVEASKIPWLIVPGNHDEVGNDWKLSKRSTLAHIFRRSKIINELKEKEEVGIYIKGYSYYHGIEKDIEEKGLICPKTDKLKIAVVHAMITQKPLPYTAMHIVVKNIKTNYDIVLVAHNHKGWLIEEIGETKFINIGAFGRKKSDEMDIEPSALYIDTESPKIEIIKLPFKSKDEVFNLERIAEVKEQQKDIQDFVNSIKDVKWEGSNIRNLVTNICKEKDIPKHIEKRITDSISKYEGEK